MSLRTRSFTDGVAAVVRLATAVAVAVSLFAAAPALAQNDNGQWPCGVEGGHDIGIPVMCILHEDGTLIIQGQGAMRDYVMSAVGGSSAPWSSRGVTLSRVKSVTVGNLVGYIGAHSFEGHFERGFTVTVNGATPPAVGNRAFGGVDLASAILYVPQGSIDDYRAADVWKDFGYLNPSTVTFDLQGGSGDIDSQFITYGGKLAEPDDPVKEDHVFDGWYADAEYAAAWDFDEDVVTSAITLYAKWTNNTSVARGVRGASAAASRVSVRGMMLMIRPSSSETISRVRLIDMRGRSAASFTARGNGNFSLTNIPAGRYFVEVRDGVGRMERTSVMIGVR